MIFEDVGEIPFLEKSKVIELLDWSLKGSHVYSKFTPAKNPR